VKINEVLVEYKYDYKLSDYQKVPYDPDMRQARPELFSTDTNPHIGPQEGKHLNLMLKGMKPMSILFLPQEQQAFEPYIKDGTFKLVAKDESNPGLPAWYVSLPGEEWRVKKLQKIENSLVDIRGNPEMERKMHAKVGALLSIPKESVKHYLKTRYPK